MGPYMGYCQTNIGIDDFRNRHLTMNYSTTALAVFYWDQDAQFWEIGRITPRMIVIHDLTTHYEPIGDGSFLATPGQIARIRRMRQTTFQNLCTDEWDGTSILVYPIRVHVGPHDKRAVLPWYITDRGFYSWCCDSLGYLPKRIGFGSMLFETSADAVLARLAI
jgi:hypothetical protein